MVNRISGLTIREVVVQVPGIVVGVLEAEGLGGHGRLAGDGDGEGEGDCGLREQIEAAVLRVQGLGQEAPPWVVDTKGQVRDMLRHGRFRPTGRSKPASEYLWNGALEGRFPRINNLVDGANLVSLESLFPISMVDRGKLGDGPLVVRLGGPLEEYVFNRSGQVFDLKDKVVVCEVGGSGAGDDRPFASPIKDSQATKTHDETNRVLGVVYAPQALAARAEEGMERLAAILSGLGASKVGWVMVPG